MGLIGLALVVMVVAAPTAHAAGGYIQVTAGLFHTCAIQQVNASGAGPVQCWGDNFYGQASAPRGVSFTQISAGDYHTCGLKPDGSVQCWGSNEKLDFCDVNVGECYYDFTGQATPRTGFTYQRISAGAYHTCGLTIEGNVICWGLNDKGQAGDKVGNYAEVTTGADFTCALRATDGGIDCWGNDKYYKTSPPAGVGFKDITAGENHACGVKTDGNVACWGGNTWGQAPGYRAGPDTQISAGDLFTCAVREGNGALDCWGYNFYGQVGQAPEGSFKQVDGGGGHACAVSSDGQIACWGRNDHDQATPPLPGAPKPPFDFQGFYPPVEPAPTLNIVKAGSSVPLKFSLGGDQTLGVLAPGFPISVQFDCASHEQVGERAATKAAGKSSLSYDPSSGTYTYVWKTDKAWAGTCRAVVLKFTDNTSHVAGFWFK
jgi:alpha-tubulin suppressor-like RCC1 family protein